MTTIKLKEISYPVFKLPSAPIVEDEIIFYYSEKEVKGETTAFVSIIDDKSVPGDSLALRRLKILSKGAKLFNLKVAVFFLGDLIKLSSPTTNFIDSNGRLFIYKKSKTVDLKFYRIEKVIPIQTGGAIVSVVGLLMRFKLLNLPSTNSKYVGILHMGMDTIIYGVYEYLPDNTKRRV